MTEMPLLNPKLGLPGTDSSLFTLMSCAGLSRRMHGVVSPMESPTVLPVGEQESPVFVRAACLRRHSMCVSQAPAPSYPAAAILFDRPVV